MRIVLFILFVSVIVSCEQEYKWEPNIKPLNTIVVDAILTNENKPQCIKLTQPLDSLNASPNAVLGAIVNVNDGSQTYDFIESASNLGLYYSLPFQAVVGKTYSLEIKYKSNTFSSLASMVPLTIDDSYELIADKGLYKYVQKNVGEPAMLEVNYNWASVPLYTLAFGNSMAREFFYILKNVDVNKEIGPEKEVIYFPKGTTIIRKKYSLTEEHQAFLRSLLMETEWRGGIFDVQQGNVISNISNGGLGYFAACTVAIDSFVVK